MPTTLSDRRLVSVDSGSMISRRMESVAVVIASSDDAAGLWRNLVEQLVKPIADLSLVEDSLLNQQLFESNYLGGEHSRQGRSRARIMGNCSSSSRFRVRSERSGVGGPGGAGTPPVNKKTIMHFFLLQIA